MAEDFNYFKRNVSIIQVAESLGYQFNPRAGRNGRVEYAHKLYPNVIITNPGHPEKQVYFTRDDDNNKGSVIDFVKHRLHLFNVMYEKEYDGVNKVLHEFAQVPYNLDSRLANQKIYQKENPKHFDKEDYNIFSPSVRDLNYLTLGRKISTETINRFLPFINIVQKKVVPPKFSFKNVGFPFKTAGKNELEGFEIVNYNFKQLPEGTKKTDAVWTAELFEKGVRPTNIFFAESAIDAMSFYELNKHKYNLDQSVFISTGGTVCANQVRNVLDNYPSAKANTIFDNDLTGKLYDIRVAAIQMKKELSISKKPDEVVFTLPGKEPIRFPLSRVSLRAFCDATGLRPEVRAHKAAGKDFNADLQKLNESQTTLKTTLKR